MLTPILITADPHTAVAHAEQFLSFIHHPNHVYEIRGLAKGGVSSGLFSNPNLAARNANKMSSVLNCNCYYSLNPLAVPIHPNTWPHRLNTASPRATKTTKGSDISIRANILIDCDPVRPSGDPATDEQLGAARRFALRVRDYLTNQGWPLPVLLCSGNGWHLLYKTPHYSTSGPHASRSLAFFLKHLASMFDDAGTKIDQNVWDPNRISRLPGFPNLKGGRIAHVVEYPEEYLPADYPTLARRWGYVAPPPLSKKMVEQLGTDDKIEQLINLYPEIFTLVKVTEDGDKTWYSFDPCPWSGESHNGMGVGKGKSCLILNADGGVSFKCFHDECADIKFSAVLKRCRDITGRWCPIMFWAPPEMTEDERRQLQELIEFCEAV